MTNNTKENLETEGDSEKYDGIYGFQLYPERRSVEEPPKGFFSSFAERKKRSDRMACEMNVYKALNHSYVLKLFIDALKSSGCPIDVARHISCEVCSNTVTGGYDLELNQIVVCQNTSTSPAKVEGTIAHEMVHMYDHCNNKVDFKNIDHLACTEIKAANLTSCSFLTSITLGTSSIFRIKQTHQECVKTRAVWSVSSARNISESEALESVNRVFPKCYNDLEPLGLRPKRKSDDFFKAYRERFLYGYGQY